MAPQVARWRCGTGNGGDGDGSDSSGGAVLGSGVAQHSVHSGGGATPRPHEPRLARSKCPLLIISDHETMLI